MMTKRKSDDHRSEINTLEPPSKKLRPSELPPLPPISPDLEQYVFTHPSAASKVNGDDTVAVIHYDRLEFLGDAHLQLVATKAIYDRYPTANAGRMAQIRQQLVQNETLCQYAQAYGFDKRLKISMVANATAQGKSKGKFSLTKVYGDVFEAYIGAVTLSFSPPSDSAHGVTALTSFLTSLWEPLWPELELKFPATVIGQKDFLTAKIMAPGVRLDYVEEKKAIIHMGKGVETYFIGVYLTGWGYTNQHLGSGKGMSKAQAGQMAASVALERSRNLVEECAAKKKEWLKARDAERAQSKAEDAIQVETGIPSQVKIESMI